MNYETRIIAEAKYLIDTKKTIREIAQYFNISKSTVHKDLQEKLINIDKDLYHQTRLILKDHLKERHLRGGEATKKKYQNMKACD